MCHLLSRAYTRYSCIRLADSNNISVDIHATTLGLGERGDYPSKGREVASHVEVLLVRDEALRTSLHRRLGEKGA